MTGPGELLQEAGATLTRVELLIDTAADQLEEPFRTALQATAADCERLRRRLRAQTLASTGTGANHGT